MAERLTTSDVACWVLKSRTAPQDIIAGWTPGRARSLTRCLRRSYRLGLMRPGQPCLLWLSGAQEPGVRAIGTLTGEPEVPEHADPSRPELAVTVSLYLLTEPVARSALLADPIFASAEVLRMPAGSNPSFLSHERWSILQEHLSPQDAAAVLAVSEGGLEPPFPVKGTSTSS